jgi:hypothetical protein
MAKGATPKEILGVAETTPKPTGGGFGHPKNLLGVAKLPHLAGLMVGRHPTAKAKEIFGVALGLGVVSAIPKISLATPIRLWGGSPPPNGKEGWWPYNFFFLFF